MKIRHFFKNLFSGITLQIQDGPLKGKKWIATSGKKFITGKFEPYKTEAFLDAFKPGSTFYDIGAHVGYFSAIASKLNKDKGYIYAFEPRPQNASFFRTHMRLNGYERFKLFQAAVGINEGDARFNTNTGSATGHLSPNGDIVVKVLNLNTLLEKGEISKPDFVKIDVEGAEKLVLQGTEKIIATHRPTLMIATHDSEGHDFVVSWLENNSYQYTILNQDGIKGDTEIIATSKI